MGVIFKGKSGEMVEFQKFNPYHDKRGRFTTANGATSFTYAPGKSKAHDNAIAREKAKHDAEQKKFKIHSVGDPKIIAGAKRGEPMTREQANKGNVNPNFSKGGAYRTNCQTCVVVYEARLRGYDVQAKPKKSWEAGQLAQNTRLAWIDPATGKNPKFIQDNTVTTAKRCKSWMESTVKKDERYTFEFAWRGLNSGHIVSLDRNSKGILRMYDPQNGKTYHGDQINKYLGNIQFSRQTMGGRKSTVRMTRVDDMRINSNYADAIMKKVK